MRDGYHSGIKSVSWLAVSLAGGLMSLGSVQAAAPSVTVVYQPMISTGLAAKQPFEAWFVFDKSSDPTIPGYEVLAGATIRFVFPQEFTPQPDLFHGAVMLHGWPQGPIAVKFTMTQELADPRALTIKFAERIAAGIAEGPGLKAVHLRASLLNPAQAGDYPISLEFTDAGALSGSTTAIAHITSQPIANIAAYNELNHGRSSNWQRVKPGEEAALPIDFLVTLPDSPRSVVSLQPAPNETVSILSDGKPIGSIRAQGVPVTLSPKSFGPGFSRLGIIRVQVRAGSQPGIAEIIAALKAGTEYKIHLVVE